MSIISEFLNSTEMRALDVIIITVISSLIFWLMTGLLSKLGRLIRSFITRIYKHLNYLFRKYVLFKISTEDLFAYSKRISNGENLKWYEKRAFDKFNNRFKEETKRIKTFEK
ncbi:hypothetical protein [Sutcliffiella sp. NC1]|uniref:hypothetical protein n=1 Tax=Sutcliffiella sp. NC1 TaxID=3004096 RepID=UPI0022DD2CF3|nr:hypothetical protein [Sutcliffiella sp. NC1]WBL16384.1 hypothetical protein O1A01_07055 [Sutcliffiella sp. NC1]